MSANANNVPSFEQDQSEQDSSCYRLSPEEVAARQQVDPVRGLSATEAQQRLQRYGHNHLADRKKESGFRAFLRQYKDFMQIVLLAAAIISLIFTQELGTSLLLFGLTIFNAVLGLRQGSKAEESRAAFQKMLKMKNIARFAEMVRRLRSMLKSWFPGTLCSWRPETVSLPMGA